MARGGRNADTMADKMNEWINGVGCTVVETFNHITFVVVEITSEYQKTRKWINNQNDNDSRRDDSLCSPHEASQRDDKTFSVNLMAFDYWALCTRLRWQSTFGCIRVVVLFFSMHFFRRELHADVSCMRRPNQEREKKKKMLCKMNTKCYDVQIKCSRRLALIVSRLWVCRVCTNIFATEANKYVAEILRQIGDKTKVQSAHGKLKRLSEIWASASK